MSKLDSSPFPDDLGEELAAEPRQGMSKVTLALAAGVVLVAGILIGIQAGKLSGDETPAAAGGQRQAGGTGQQQGGGPPGYGQQQGGGPPGYGQQRNGGFGGGQRMGGGTFGTVEKVEDGKVYVKTMDGKTVTVTTTDRTTVQIAKPGKVTDLERGSDVTVRGEQGADGSVTASAITQGGWQFPGGGPR
ncbi:hypothetical protein Nocox_17500 [Nonomuraea coxensis DSM 45129]|uniref:DUF5666 domain-containing protein n=1 Tax=Nonomuraea coxensis DSM 45129 TaxID=1122611 RepID=A0ABX8U0X0_9ACTN|nr:hypothetical protein [Nonomuraea coxensis]QYC41111.1 hypothetical protein Nocox_17500 [Nonomuraea coxensis DSM 45129]